MFISSNSQLNNRIRFVVPNVNETMELRRADASIEPDKTPVIPWSIGEIIWVTSDNRMGSVVASNKALRETGKFLVCIFNVIPMNHEPQHLLIKVQSPYVSSCSPLCSDAVFLFVKKDRILGRSFLDGRVSLFQLFRLFVRLHHLPENGECVCVLYLFGNVRCPVFVRFLTLLCWFLAERLMVALRTSRIEHQWWPEQRDVQAEMEETMELLNSPSVAFDTRYVLFSMLSTFSSSCG